MVKKDWILRFRIKGSSRVCTMQTEANSRSDVIRGFKRGYVASHPTPQLIEILGCEELGEQQGFLEL